VPRPVDDLVYASPDGEMYVARFDDEEDAADQWTMWPAERNGWVSRRRCPGAHVDDCHELPPRLAALALQLSGVPTDDR
jgi:hypothetical protein